MPAQYAFVGKHSKRGFFLKNEKELLQVEDTLKLQKC